MTDFGRISQWIAYFLLASFRGSLSLQKPAKTNSSLTCACYRRANYAQATLDAIVIAVRSLVLALPDDRKIALADNLTHNLCRY